MERELEPYGLVLKAGVWYLCARVAGDGSFRVYRIDRFTAVEAGGERFVRDEEFDLPGVLGGAGRAVRAVDPARRGRRTAVPGGGAQTAVRRRSPSAREALAAAGAAGRATGG